MEGSWTLECSSWPPGSLDCFSSDGVVWLAFPSSSQEFCSEWLGLLGCGDAAGVRARFSPLETMLLSVSAVDVAELDMRREA